MNNIEIFWELVGEHKYLVVALPTEYLLKNKETDNFVLIGVEADNDSPYVKNADFKGNVLDYKTPTIEKEQFFDWLFDGLSITDLVTLLNF